MKKADFIGVGVIYLIVAIGWWETDGLPANVQAFPRFLLVLLGLLGTVVLLKLLYRIRQAVWPEAFLEHRGRFATIAGLMAAYLVAMPIMGFFVTGFVFAMTAPLLIGWRNIRILAPTMTGFMVLLYLIFVLGLQRPLPHGLLF